MDDNLCGYYILRKPEHNDDPHRHLLNRRIRGAAYQGVERMPWADVRGKFYRGQLDSKCTSLFREIRQAYQDDTGFELCPSRSITELLLACSGPEASLSEVTALWSPVLNQIKGGDVISDSCIRWLGYDVLPFGWWSMIAEGVYRVPQLFPESVSRLNEFGLLDNLESVQALESEYADAASKQAVEQYPDERCPEWVRVGRLTREDVST